MNVAMPEPVHLDTQLMDVRRFQKMSAAAANRRKYLESQKEDNDRLVAQLPITSISQNRI